MPEFPSNNHEESHTETQHGPGWLHDEHDTTTHENSTDASSDTPDWLKESGSPFGEEDVLAKEVSSSEKKNETATTPAQTTTHTTSSDIPDWLHDSHDTQHTSEKPETTPKAETQATTPKTNDIPDWLHEDTHPSTIPDTTATPVVPTNEPTTTGTSAPSAPTKQDLPDWLSGAETEETKMPEPVATIEQTSAIEPSKDNEIFASTPESTGLTPTTPTPVSLDHDDIPDWLRGAEEVTESTVDA